MAANSEVQVRLRQRQIAGVLILLGVIAAASLYRAGFARVFPPGWWHIW